MTNPTKPTSVRLPDDIKQRVQEAADAERRSFANMLEVICAEWLQARAMKEHAPEARRQPNPEHSPL